jgi:hypothetical protein
VESTIYLSDDRYRRLAQRLVYFERPDLLEDQHREAICEGLRKRLMGPIEALTKWRTIPVAQQEIEAVIASGVRGTALAGQLQYASYLAERARALVIDGQRR